MRRGGWIALGCLLLAVLVTQLMSRCGNAAPAPPGDEAHTPAPPAAPSPQPAVQQGERTLDGDPAPTRTVVPAEAEWTKAEDFEPLLRDEPPGTLGVVVLRGRHRVADVRVRVWAAAALFINPAETAATTPWAEARTDADGRAQFTGALAGEYVVRADDGGENLVAGIDKTVKPDRTLVLVFGTCTVTGRVCDRAGVAVVGRPVRLRGLGPVSRASITASTDRDGEFSFSGVPAGRFYVIAPGVMATVGEERRISLAPGEHARILFGRTGPLATWRGRLLDAEGGIVPGRRVFAARDPATKDERRLLIAADGTFAVDLPPGAWVVHGDGGLFLGQQLDHIEVPARGLQRDLTYTGHRLVFTIGSCGRLHDAVTVALQLWLRGPGVSTQAEGPFASPAGQYVQWLVERPGSYRVIAGNATLVGAVDGHLAVEVAATMFVHRWTLFVQ